MALKPIVGEIRSQVLNDNFSYLDERIVEGAQDPRVDDLIADFNAHKADLAKYARFVITTNQSIPNATFTHINWGNKQSFNGEDFCALENGRIKILKSGMYQLQVVVNFAINSVGIRGYWGVVSNQVRPPDASFSIATVEFVYASEGQLLNTRVYQNSGGSLDIFGSNNTFCELRKVV